MSKKKIPRLFIIVILMLISALLCARSYKSHVKNIENQHRDYDIVINQNETMDYAILWYNQENYSMPEIML